MNSTMAKYIGIGISVVIVIVGALLVLWALGVMSLGGGTVGEPTDATMSPGALNKIELDLDVTKLITPAPTSGVGAEASYETAVKDAFAAGDEFLTKIKESQDPTQDSTFKSILQKLESAADKGMADRELDFESIMPLTTKTEWDIRNTLYGMGMVATRSAMAMREAKDRAGADKALRAGLVWGLRLWKHGTPVAYRSAALSCISEALSEYQVHYSDKFYNDPAKAATAKELYDIYLPVVKKWYDKQQMVWVPRLNPDAGDLWNMAEHDQDRGWRMEGIMWLGVAQWTSATAGPQRTSIQKYLAEKSRASDPVIAKRAKEALDTTRVDVRSIPVRN